MKWRIIRAAVGAPAAQTTGDTARSTCGHAYTSTQADASSTGIASAQVTSVAASSSLQPSRRLAESQAPAYPSGHRIEDMPGRPRRPTGLRVVDRA